MNGIRVLFLSAFLIMAADLRIDCQSQLRDYELSFILGPSFAMPVSRQDLFDPGGGVDFLARYDVPFAEILAIESAFCYRYDPVKTVDSLSILDLQGGVAVTGRIKDFSIGASARGGWYQAFRNSSPSSNSGNPSLYAGFSAGWRLFPALSLSLSGGWRDYLGLHSEVSVSLSTSIHVLTAVGKQHLLNESPELLPLEGAPIGKNSGLALSKVEIDPVFPVLFKGYDEKALGRAFLKNHERRTVDDVKVSFFESQYMAMSTPCAVPTSIKPGEEVVVDIRGLFSDKVLSLTEGTKVMARISVEYTLQGRRFRFEEAVPLVFLHRNAITWDDDRKAAVFVTAKDPAILKFARTTAAVADSLQYGDIDRNCIYAMAIFDSLGAFGMNYKADPVTPYARLSAERLSVDYLQFPIQTLEYRSGDCDDLTVLYSALLESIGIETALITVPGHILCAFALSGDGVKARAWFSDRGDFIEAAGKVWVPVETTMMGKGFLEAWHAGAGIWAVNNGHGAAHYPVRECWVRYPSVGFVIEGAAPEPPTPDAELKLVSSELIWLAEREVKPRLAAMEKEAGSAVLDPRWRNRAGVLYARYALFDRAETQFNAAAGYGPAAVNLGNLLVIRGNYEKASAAFTRAAKDFPGLEAAALDGLVRCLAAVGDREGYTQAWSRLKKIDPSKAERYAFLAEASGARAAEVAAGGLTWHE